LRGVVSGKQKDAAQADGLHLGMAQELVDRARAEGTLLVGPGGLLSGLAKQVLATALGAEMDEHLGYAHGDRAGKDTGNERGRDQDQDA
jgi:transposase-like protein